MLKAVSISNIAVIKELSVDFDDGFTVITGETGAGKSILIDSVAFVLGARAAKDIVRTGESRAEVWAVFSDLEGKKEYLESTGFPIDENGELCLYRYMTDEGKTGAKINGKSVSLSILKQVSKALLTIHGQNDSGALSEKSELIELLDGYIGLDNELSAYGEVYNTLCSLKNELSELRASVRDKTMMLDILKYQLKEIENAKLSDPEEEDKLLKLRVKLRSLEKVSKSISVVNKALIENEKGITASYMLERAASAIRQLGDVLDNSEELASKLDSFRYEISDISDEVSELISDDEMTDPDKKLDIVESRLSLIKKLRSKYGETVADIIAKRDEIKRRISDLENSDDAVKDIEDRINDTVSVAADRARVLSERRKENAEKLNSQISSVLHELDMPKVRFKIDVQTRSENDEHRFDGKGFDDVDFLVSPNIGEDLQPISKIASGGELSRIMLAVKSSMLLRSGEGTSVFDEIDAGVSGGTSERIGRKLLDMSKTTQIICITHSAQIASLADVHIKICKSEQNGRVESFASTLDREGRIKELSRIIGGINITEKQINAATEMLDKAASIQK